MALVEFPISAIDVQVYDPPVVPFVTIIYFSASVNDIQPDEVFTFNGLTGIPQLNGMTMTLKQETAIEDEFLYPQYAIWDINTISIRHGSTPPWGGVQTIDPETGFISVIRDGTEDGMTSPVTAKIQNVFPPRAGQYFPSVATGTTVNLRRDFKGFGALLAYSVPLGQTVTAVMLPPVGPRAQGNPFRATITSSATSDIVVFET
jgi:hypothetical protein